MKAVITSDTNQEYHVNNEAVVKDSYSEVSKCNKAIICDDSFKAVSGNLVGTSGTLVDLQALIDAAVSKALEDLLGDSNNIPNGVEDLIDDLVTGAVDSNSVINNVSADVEDILYVIGDDIANIEAGTLSGLVDKYDNILTTVEDPETGLAARVEENAVSYVTLDQKVNRVGSVYSMDVTAGGAIAGFTIVAADGNKPISQFIVRAEDFMVARGIDENGEVVGTPAFAINGNNIGFNGQVSFNSLTNGAGQTIIDGGLITTQDVKIANSLIVGSTLSPVNYGKFSKTVNSVVYTKPDDSGYIADAILAGLLPVGTQLQFGDKYNDDNYEYEYVFENEGSWKSVQVVASSDATTKADAAVVEAAAATSIAAAAAEQSAKDNLAVQIGYNNYNDMVSKAATVGKVVINGGYLNASVIAANTIIGTHILGSTITAGKVDFIGDSTGENSIYYDATSGKLVLGDIRAKSIEAGAAVVSSGNGGELSSHIVSISEKNSSDTSDGYSVLHLEAGDSIGAALYMSRGTALLPEIYAEKVVGSTLKTGEATTILKELTLEGYSTGVVKGVTIKNISTGYQIGGDGWHFKADGGLHTSSVSSFSGTHSSKLLSKCLEGDIVEDTGKVKKESVVQGYGEVTVTTTAKSKAVLGAYCGSSVEENYRDNVLSLGEGYINVCSQNGDIECGDYICSSDVQGKGMKQDDDLLHNYTVAKSRENIVWGELEVDNETVFEQDGYKWTQVACTYHCG